MNLYNVNSLNVKMLNINKQSISKIDTQSLSPNYNCIPTSALINQKFIELNNNYLSIIDYQHTWNVSSYYKGSDILDIPKLYCKINLNDSIDYNSLTTEPYTTQNFKNNTLINSEIEDYINISTTKLNSACSIILYDDYPYSIICIPTAIIINVNNEIKKYIPTILKYDKFYNITSIKAPSVKIFNNTNIGEQIISGEMKLENAAVVKCNNLTTIYENIPVELTTQTHIIPNIEYLSDSEFIPTKKTQNNKQINNQSIILIHTHSPVNLLAFIKKGSTITGGINRTYINDTLYHNKISESINDSDYAELTIIKSYLSIPANCEIKLTYGSIIYAGSLFENDFEIFYNNQQFKLKNIPNHGIAKNPNNDYDKQLDGFYVIGGVIAYNRLNQENKIFLPKNTVLTPGSIINITSTYQNNQHIDMDAILGSNNYCKITLNYYNISNLNTYIILNSTTLLRDLYLATINTDDIWKSQYSYPCLIANTLSIFKENAELYDVTSYYDLNNMTQPILTNLYSSSITNSKLIPISYKDYSFVIRDNNFETINQTVYGYASNISVTGGNVNIGDYTIQTSFGDYNINKYASTSDQNPLIINIITNLQSGIQLKNYTLLIHSSSNVNCIINDNGVTTTFTDEIIKYTPLTTIYDQIYSPCIIKITSGDVYLIELIPTTLNISNDYFDDCNVKIYKDIQISDTYITNTANNVYLKYNCLIRAGSKIAKGSIVNGKTYMEDYIIPIQITPIIIPSSLTNDSIIKATSQIMSGSKINGQDIIIDVTLSQDIIINDTTIIAINSKLAPNTILKENTLINGHKLPSDVILSGFLVVTSDSYLNIGTIILTDSLLTFENPLKYINRNDLIVKDNLLLFNDSIINKGSKITIGSIVNNKIIEHITNEDINISSNSILMPGTILSSGTVLNTGSVLNGEYCYGENDSLNVNTNILGYTRLLSGTTLNKGTIISKGSIINGETIKGTYSAINIDSEYTVTGNENYDGIKLTAGSKLKINSKYTINDNNITITTGDKFNVQNSLILSNNLTLNNNDIITANSSILIGSIINGESVTNSDYEIVGRDGRVIDEGGLIVKNQSLIKSGSKIIIGSNINGKLYTDEDKTPIAVINDFIIDNTNIDKYKNLNNGDILETGTRIYTGSVINDEHYNNITAVNNYTYDSSNNELLDEIISHTIITPGSIVNGETIKGVEKIITNSSSTTYEGEQIPISGIIYTGSKIIGPAMINGITYQADYEEINIAQPQIYINENSEYYKKVIAIGSKVLVGSIINGINVEDNKTRTINNKNDLDNLITDMSELKIYSTIICNNPNNKSKWTYIVTEININNLISFTGTVGFTEGSKYYENGEFKIVPNGEIKEMWVTELVSGTILKTKSYLSGYVNFGNDYPEYELKCILSGAVLSDTSINVEIYAARGSIINGNVLSENTTLARYTWIQNGSYFADGSFTTYGLVLDGIEYKNVKIPFDIFSSGIWDGCRFDGNSVLLKGSKIKILKEYIIDQNIRLTNNSYVGTFTTLYDSYSPNSNIPLNKNLITRFNSDSNVKFIGYIELSRTTITSGIIKEKSIIKANSILKAYSTYRLLDSDINVTMNSTLKANTFLSENSKIYIDSSEFYIIPETIIINSNTLILSRSTLNDGSTYYSDKYTLLNDIDNIDTMTLINGSIINSGSILKKLVDITIIYSNNVNINTESYINTGSILSINSIIQSGSIINNNIMYGKQKILYSDTITIKKHKTFNILAGSFIIAGSNINGVEYSIDEITGKDIYFDSDENNVFIKKNSIFITGSSIDGITINTNYTFPFDYSNLTLLNASSLIKEKSNIIKNSIINNEEIINETINTDLTINNQSYLNVNSKIINGSTLINCIINGKTINETITADIIISNSHSSLTKGSILKIGSIISPGSSINNVNYSTMTTLTNDLLIRNYSEILSDSVIITGSKIINEKNEIEIVGNVLDINHFDDPNHICNLKTQLRENEALKEFIKIEPSRKEQSKMSQGIPSFINIVDIVLSDVYLIKNINESGSKIRMIDDNNLRNNNLRNNNNNDINNNDINNNDNLRNNNDNNEIEYAITKLYSPLYIKETVNTDELIVVNQDSKIIGDNIEIKIVKYFNNDLTEPYADNINTIIIESDEFYSNCFNLKTTNNNISHVIFKNQKIIDPSNIIVRNGSNITFDTFRMEQIYIIPSEFTHIDIPKNNGWYRNCITNCIEYSSRLIYGLSNDNIIKNNNAKNETKIQIAQSNKYIFNLWDILSTIYITVESEFAQNLIMLCINNRKLIDDVIVKVNNQHLNLYIQSEKYKKIINDTEKYSYVNIISEGYHNKLIEYEMIKNNNLLFVDKTNYYDSTFGLEIDIIDNTENENENQIEYYYSENCLKNLNKKRIIFASNINDDNEYYTIGFKNNIFVINEDDLIETLTILPGTNLKTLYILKNNIILHIKDYVRCLTISDNIIDANGLTIKLGENNYLDAIIIDEPTVLNRNNIKTMYINAKNFVFESTLHLGSMENYSNLNRNLYVNYKLLNITMELDSDYHSGYLNIMDIDNNQHAIIYNNPNDTTDYGDAIVNGVIVKMEKFEELRGYKTPIIFNNINVLKQYFNDDILKTILLVRAVMEVPGIAVVADYCNIYLYYNVNSWRTANVKVYDYIKSA